MKLREIYEKEILKQFGTRYLNEDFVEEDINQEEYEGMIFMKIRKINLLTENGINNFPTNKIAQEDNINDDDDDDDDEDNDNKYEFDYSYCSIHRRKANNNRKKEKEKDQMKKTQHKQGPTEKKTESRKRKAISSKSKDQIRDENEDDSDSATKDIKKRKKKIIKKHFDTIRNRCTPGVVFSVIQGFNEMKEVPGALSCFVLKNFNSETKKIVLQKGVIDVTKESIKEILGFPLGRKQFSKHPFRTKEDKCYEEWTNQLDDKKMIRLQDIKMKIVSTNKSFDPSNPTSNFNGPFAYLVLLNIQRTRPMFCHWTLEKIKMRETFEKDKLGDFGTGDFNDEYVDEELNEEAYEHVVMNKYRKLHMLIEDDKSEDNQEKNGNDHVENDNSDDDDNNGDDNDQSKKKNVGRENIQRVMGQENENLKGGEEQQRKNKDEGGEDIKITDENDINDQGLDYMNLNDEGVENEKGGDNEEQNAEGEVNKNID
ncbi:uncharacterized protein LOC128133744 [Lactuca sativa]|uniref:uncharacterized protein LOC128133744 n=1 Tax=Lactuca sativa TaxID=4236 RepID=UPI0022AE5A1E|nr:uncharacterized protein LOC128133744 [Lactuca sativa]